MLITGTSRGIGLACAEYFQDRYEIVGIARTPGKFVTEQGSVADEKFRQYIIDKYTPDVFINNAGIGGSDFSEIIRVNSEASTHFMIAFFKKMNKGYIINISSWLASVLRFEHNNGNFEEAVYSATKKSIKEISKSLSNNKSKIKAKVISIEPQYVDTDMISNTKTNYTKLIEPEYIAKTIDWIIQQPGWVNIDSICISNWPT